jgi:lactoylglutathione lyase
MFVHTSIRTSNLDRSIAFYVKFLGLKLISRRDISQNNAEIAFLKDPEGKGATLELTCYKNQKRFIQADYENRLFDHLAFEVRNIEKTLENMRAEGVIVTDEPFKLGSNGSVIAFIEDPEGILIELIQR